MTISEAIESLNINEFTHIVVYLDRVPIGGGSPGIIRFRFGTRVIKKTMVEDCVLKFHVV